MGIDPRRYDQRSSYYRLTELIKALNETNEEVGKLKKKSFGIRKMISRKNYDCDSNRR